MRISTSQSPYCATHWQAVDLDNYDAELVDGEWTTSSPYGTGRTEDEAIADLLEQISSTEED